MDKKVDTKKEEVPTRDQWEVLSNYGEAREH